MTNIYTARWFDLFLRPINPQQTIREVAFLQHFLPRPAYCTIIDLCCGTGRHVHQLAAQSYTVVGVDRDPQAITEARIHALPTESYLQHDMRQLQQLQLHADAILCLWQSFGYFEPAANHAIIQDVADTLSVGGRFILDIYHRDFFQARQGTRTFTLSGSELTERKRVVDGRLYVTLSEATGALIDTFEWQLWTPDECVMLAQSVGLSCVAACTNFDVQQQPSAAFPRVQYVFEKHGDTQA